MKQIVAVWTAATLTFVLVLVRKPTNLNVPER